MIIYFIIHAEIDLHVFFLNIKTNKCSKKKINDYKLIKIMIFRKK